MASSSSPPLVRRESNGWDEPTYAPAWQQGVAYAAKNPHLDPQWAARTYAAQAHASTNQDALARFYAGLNAAKSGSSGGSGGSGGGYRSYGYRSGGGGGGGGGGGASSANAAIKTLYQLYNKPVDQTLTDTITRLSGQASAAGNSALANLQAGISGMQNPYTDVPMPQAQTAQNPMSQFMQANGASTGGVDQLVQMLGASNGQMQNADQAMLARMQQAWSAAQQARSADAAGANQAFQGQVANNAAAYQYRAEQDRQKLRQELMMKMVEMAAARGVNLKKIGVTL